MIHSRDIWEIIQAKIIRSRWIPLEEIYQVVGEYGDLDDDDFEPQSSTSDIPKWKRNVRNVLQYRKRKSEIQWDGKGRYLLSNL